MSIERYDDSKAAFFREFEKLRPDLLYSEVWSEGEKDQALEYLRPNRIKLGMVASIPLNCEAEKCPFAQSCPLFEKGIAPKGNPCPIEMSAAMQFFYDYVKELDVDVERMVEVSLVRDLVDQEIQQMRKTWLLRQEHFIQENVVGIDAEGNVVTKKELHQAIEYEEKLLKRKERIRNQLLATREAKAKAGQGHTDSAQAVANVLDKVRELNIQREEDLKRELGLLEHDEYVDGEIVDEIPEKDE